MTFTLSQVAQAMAAAAAPPPLAVAGWSVDTRSLSGGELFFALPGPNHDGHDFLAEAFARGAVAAVVERAVPTTGLTLEVPHTLEALQRLAAWARAQWSGKLVAITGSAGKTTTKDLTAALLAVALPVGKSEGNLNNHVGVPLSLLRLPAQARVAVIEIGMNHPGEIRRLAGLVRPDVGVVLNIGHAHAGFFGSLEEVARAKRELIEALPAGATAVLNADDQRVAAFREIHAGPVVTFGLAEGADVRAEQVEYTAEGARFRVGGVDFEIALMGQPGVMNVLAGLAVARVFGIEPGSLREAARALQPGPMRGRRFAHHGVTVLDDCYNSNPEAARAMLEALRATPARRRVAVLGEMLELGEHGEALHRQLGREVATGGVDVLVSVRGAARFIAEEALRSGLPAGAVFSFEDPAEAGAFLRGLAQPGDAVLFKGSRGVALERALERFLE